MPTVKKAPVIGGPLNGQYANRADFFPGYSTPQFEAFRREYVAFNNASGRRQEPSMVWLHTSLLRPAARMRQSP